MRGAVFMDTLRSNWQQMLYWGIGLGAMALLVVALVPYIDAMQMIEAMESLPPVIMRAAGIDDISVLATPEGFIAAGFFSKLTIIFAAYPVITGMRATINEEDEGIMDSILSLPLQRGRFLIEKFAALVVMLVVITILVMIGTLIGVQMIDVEVNLGRLMISVINLLPMMIFVLAFTVFVGALIGRRQLALGVITAYVIASFMLQTVGGMAEGSFAEIISGLSFFTYYDASGVIKSGLNPVHVAGFMGLAALLMSGAVFAWQRRDIRA